MPHGDTHTTHTKADTSVQTHTHTHSLATQSALQDGWGVIRQRSVAAFTRNIRAGGTHQSSAHTHTQRRGVGGEGGINPSQRMVHG